MPSWLKTYLIIDSVAKRYQISPKEVTKLNLMEINIALTMNELEGKVRKRAEAKAKTGG